MQMEGTKSYHHHRQGEKISMLKAFKRQTTSQRKFTLE